MKTIPFALPVLIFSFMAGIRDLHAQDSLPVLSLSLNEVKKIVKENNPDLALAKVNTEMANRKVEEALRGRVPEIYGDVNLRNNLIIPTTPVPAKAFDPTAPEGEVLPLRFNTRWGANAGIHAAVDLYNPEKKSLISEAEKLADIEKTNELISENDLRLQAGEAYLRALIAREQLRLSASDTLTRHTVYLMSSDQHAAGRLPLETLNRLMADLNNARFRFEEAGNIYENAKSELLYLLGYDPLKPVQIVFNETIENLGTSPDAETSVWEEEKDLQLIRTRQQDELTAIRLRALKSGYFPTLSLNGYYGANFFDNKFGIFQSSNWFGNSFLSLGIKIPLTEGFVRSKKIEELQLERQATGFAYQSRLNKNRLDYIRFRRDVQLFRKKYGVNKLNFQLAEENLQLAEEKYQSGRLLIGELYQAMYNRDKEKTSYLQAAYDLMNARLRLESLIIQ